MAFELCPEEVNFLNYSRELFTLTWNSQEQEEPNDSEVEPTEDYQQQTSKVIKETASEGGTAETQVLAATSSADEEAVNKVAEKIDTLRMGPRQVILNLFLRNICQLNFDIHQEHEMDESTSSPSTVILAEDLPDPDPEIVPGKIVNIQPTAPSLQSGITEQKS